jgi:hypothetical protein
VSVQVSHAARKNPPPVSTELGIPQKIVWKILRKRLQLYPYQLQLLQALKPVDKGHRLSFCLSVQTLMETDGFVESLVFSDESTFHLSGKDITSESGGRKTHMPTWSICATPPCAITHEKVYGPFFFTETTITGISYLDMLQQWLLPQLEEDSPGFIFQQDGAPPQFHNEVRSELNDRLSNRWIGRAGPDDDELLRWPDGVKFKGYVGTNAESLCVEFCNSVQGHTFVNYLIRCY